jgi:hypothetical protein
VHRQVLRLGRRIIIAVVGGAVIVVGLVLAMPLIPGPGLALMLLGLGILSLEFQRPRIWLVRIKAEGLQLKDKLFRWLARIKARTFLLWNKLLRRRSPPRDKQ